MAEGHWFNPIEIAISITQEKPQPQAKRSQDSSPPISVATASIAESTEGAAWEDCATDPETHGQRYPGSQKGHTTFRYRGEVVHLGAIESLAGEARTQRLWSSQAGYVPSSDECEGSQGTSRIPLRTEGATSKTNQEGEEGR